MVAHRRGGGEIAPLGRGGVFVTWHLVLCEVLRVLEPGVGSTAGHGSDDEERFGTLDHGFRDNGLR